MNDTILSGLVKLAVKEGHDEYRSPVIQKELLHYDILFCLKQAGLLNGLVFQGGTISGWKWGDFCPRQPTSAPWPTRSSSCSW